MKRGITTGAIAGTAAAILQSSAHAKQSGVPVFGHTDPSKYRTVAKAHGGAGELPFMELLNHEVFDSTFLFVHRAELPPKTGIGEHVHRHMEEMYYIFNGVAQFTVNGQMAELAGPCCVLCPRGSSHGIYNHTDETLQWLNVAVSDVKGKGDAVDLGNDLTNMKIVSPTPFLWTPIDNSLLRDVSKAHLGKGIVMFKRLWWEESYKTDWMFTDHCLLKPDTSIGYHQHNTIEEIYYIVTGHGTMTVNDHTFAVGPGDAVPCTLHDSHGLYNSGSEDILLIVNACKGRGDGLFPAKNWDDDLSDRTAK
ncbi:cupin domain-containing protein [Candidatus Latescibacterota bacterium]